MKGIADSLRCRGHPCDKKKLAMLRFIFVCGEKGSAKFLFSTTSNYYSFRMTTFFFPDCFSRWRNNGAPVINIILIYISTILQVGDFVNKTTLNRYFCPMSTNCSFCCNTFVYFVICVLYAMLSLQFYQLQSKLPVVGEFLVGTDKCKPARYCTCYYIAVEHVGMFRSVNLEYRNLVEGGENCRSR